MHEIISAFRELFHKYCGGDDYKSVLQLFEVRAIGASWIVDFDKDKAVLDCVYKKCTLLE